MSTEHIEEHTGFLCIYANLLISMGKQEIDIQGKAGICFLSLVHVNDQNKICKLACISLPRLIL